MSKCGRQSVHHLEIVHAKFQVTAAVSAAAVTILRAFFGLFWTRSDARCKMAMKIQSFNCGKLFMVIFVFSTITSTRKSVCVKDLCNQWIFWAAYYTWLLYMTPTFDPPGLSQKFWKMYFFLFYQFKHGIWNKVMHWSISHQQKLRKKMSLTHTHPGLL